MAGGRNLREKTVAPAVLRVPKHGKGKLRVGNPGNSGRPSDAAKAYAEQRAAEIMGTPQVWDVQLAYAKSGNLDSLKFARETAFGKPAEKTEVSGEVTVRVEFDD